MPLTEASAAALAAGLSAVGGIASSGISAASTAINNARQYNYWLMQQQYNKKLWKEQQEYNSPANQMKRFAEAGLNPNLIYGNVNNTANNAPFASSAPNYQAPDYSQMAKAPYEAMTAAMNIHQMYNAIALQKKQVEAIDEANNLKREQAEYYRKRALTEGLNFDLNTLKYNAYSNGGYFDKLVDNLARRNLFLNLQNEGKELENAYFRQSIPLDLAIKALTANNIKAHTNYYNSASSLNYSKKKYQDFRTESERYKFINYDKEAIPWKLSLDEQNYFAKKAQTELFGSRSGYTDMKTLLAPLQFAFDAATSLMEFGVAKPKPKYK